jgi:hypothetical protein
MVLEFQEPEFVALVLVECGEFHGVEDMSGVWVVECELLSVGSLLCCHVYLLLSRI